jgi:hypothetical protein
MDYPATENTQKYKNRSNFYPSIRDKNPSPAIVQYLKKNNYKFVIAPPKWGGCPSSIDYICLTPTSNSYYESIFYDYAISVFLEKSLLNKIEITYNSFFINKDINDTIITTIDKMKKNPQIWSNGGVFTMIHMMIPHQPYREHNCTITDRFSNPSKEGYKSSAYCAFNRIHKISDFIIKNFPNATIVVQSDHGVDTNLYEGKKFNEISHSLIDQRMGSFTAVRGCNAKQAAKLNQVHIIKSIVDCVSGNTQTKQLENKSYFGLYEQSPDFGKVFQVFTHN